MRQLTESNIYPLCDQKTPLGSGVDKFRMRVLTNGYNWASLGPTAGYLTGMGPNHTPPGACGMAIFFRVIHHRSP